MKKLKKYLTINLFQWTVLIVYIVYMLWLAGTTKKSLEQKETRKDPYEEFDKMFE